MYNLYAIPCMWIIMTTLYACAVVIVANKEGTRALALAAIAGQLILGGHLYAIAVS